MFMTKAKPGQFLLPDLEPVEVDVVLDVLEGPAETGNGLGQDRQLGRKFAGLKKISSKW